MRKKIKLETEERNSSIIDAKEAPQNKIFSCVVINMIIQTVSEIQTVAAFYKTNSF